MKEVSIIFFLCWIQVAIGQSPIGTLDISTVPVLEMPHLDNDKLVQKELTKRNKSQVRAPEFATACEVDNDCFDSGKWNVVGDRATWKLLIKSEGAESLNFGFSDFYLPPTASFYMTGVTSGQRRGPFVSADNDPHDQFWSPIIEDDEVLLELEVDVDMKEHVRLNLSKVNHACLLYTSPSPRDRQKSRMPSSA